MQDDKSFLAHAEGKNEAITLLDLQHLFCKKCPVESTRDVLRGNSRAEFILCHITMLCHYAGLGTITQTVFSTFQTLRMRGHRT